MDAPGIPPGGLAPVSRATGATGRSAGAAPIAWAVGERVVAQVLRALDTGQFLLGVGGQQVLARSQAALQPGQQLALEVVRLSPEVELRVLRDAQRVADQQHAAATLFLARGSPAQPPVATQLARLAAAIMATASPASDQAPDTQSPLAALARQLAPLAREASPAETSARLRTLVESGGTLLEAKLRAALEGTPAEALARALPPHLASEARVLLGRLLSARTRAGDVARDVGREAPVVASDTPATTRGAQAGSGMGSGAEFERAGELLLARQLDVAYEWVRHGVLQLPFALRLDEQDREALVRFRPEGDDGEEHDERRGGDLSFAVDLGDLGRLAAELRWSGRALAAHLAAEREAVADAARGEVPALTEALRRAGFDEVGVTVDVDPSGVTAAFERRDDPPPAGSMLDLRA